MPWGSFAPGWWRTEPTPARAIGERRGVEGSDHVYGHGPAPEGVSTPQVVGRLHHDVAIRGAQHLAHRGACMWAAGVANGHPLVPRNDEEGQRCRLRRASQADRGRSGACRAGGRRCADESATPWTRGACPGTLVLRRWTLVAGARGTLCGDDRRGSLAQPVMRREDSRSRFGADLVIGRGALSAMRDLLWTRSTLWLLGNSLAALASRSAYAAEQWGIVVLIARATTPATVGIYGLASAIVAPVFGLFSMDLRALLATDYNGRHRATEYMTVRLTTALLAMLCALAGAVLLGYSSTLLLVVLLIALRRVVEGLSDILFAVMQKHERMDLPAKSSTVKALVSVTAAGLLLMTTHSLLLALSALVLASLGILLLYDARLVEKVEPRGFWRTDLVRGHGLVRQAAPLGIVTALIAFQTSVPRFFLAAYQGDI